MGGLTLIQAKHYKNVMGVNHIRELASAMEEKKAGRGILVTTSWFTTGRWQKADEHGRMELIDTVRPARRRPRAKMELASVPFSGRGSSRARDLVRRWQSLVS